MTKIFIIGAAGFFFKCVTRLPGSDINLFQIILSRISVLGIMRITENA